MRRSKHYSSVEGFTLVELAIVLMIVGLLVGGIVISVGAQQESSARTSTERRATEVIEALIGFAAANNRLPCPAAPPDDPTPAKRLGVEQPAGGGNCEYDWTGFVPARTLGLSPTDANGYLLDAWGNPMHYAVTTANADSFTTASGMKNNWSGGMTPDLRVCSTGVGITGGECANATVTLADSAVAVVFSRAKNGASAPSSTDESANGNYDRVFVSHTPTPPGSGNEFDDIVVWLSPNILYNRMIAAGRLP